MHKAQSDEKGGRGDDDSEAFEMGANALYKEAQGAS